MSYKRDTLTNVSQYICTIIIHITYKLTETRVTHLNAQTAKFKNK